MRSKSRFTTLVLLETPESLSSDPCAIALYASRPLSPGATQHSLPSGRLLGPVFHRLDRTSLPGALIRSPRRRGRAAPKRWGCQALLCFVEPGEDTRTLSTSRKGHWTVLRFMEPSHRVLAQNISNWPISAS